MNKQPIPMTELSNISNSIADIKDEYKERGSVSQKYLNALKTDLNRAFKGSTCAEVTVANNTDKMFFGMCVMPHITTDDINTIITDDKPFIIDRYYLEIDSKLIDQTLNLSYQELTAILLHEIGHLVNTSIPVDKIRKELDIYLMNEEKSINLTKFEQCKELFVFAVKDSIRKVTSMFENPNKEEILADEFVIACGYGQYLISALKKIEQKAFNVNKDVSNKFVVFTWVLQLYKNLGERRIAANHTLKKMSKITGSNLVKKELNRTSMALDSISITEADNKVDKKYKFKYDILRKYEDNYYEYAIRLKSANIEEDALRLLRELNCRISVIEEFLNEVELTDTDRKRFSKLYDNYLELRDTLSKKNIVKNTHLGLWVEYPDL